MSGRRSGPSRRWRLASAADDQLRRLQDEVRVSPLLARLLANRGLADPALVDAFLSSRLSEHLRSPMLFRDMGKAASRVVDALARAEPIGIYGDYDVDGISGTALLIRFLRALGTEPIVYIPHRMRDGYGVSERGMRRLAEQGAKVVITVDCGGVAHREIALARALAMDVIVCDHHQVSGVPLQAAAVLNPIEPDAGFPFSGLCGAGVAFYLALGVRMLLRERVGNAVPDLRRYLDLVALGTVADLVPVVAENRVLVKHGLRELEKSERAGIAALRTVSGVREVSTTAVGFRLAPRLNAGGRLDDATRSVELLITDDVERARALASGLDDENRARQAIEREIFDEAVAMVEAEGGVAGRCSIVLGSASWHPGVIGIVASRLVELYYRPTVLIALDCAPGLGRGSGRSIRGVDLHQALQACRASLLGCGGHRMAAGLSIDPQKLGEFRDRFEAVMREATTEESFVAVRDVDAELGLGSIDGACLADIERLEPYGQGNPEPVFLSRAVRVRGQRIVGEAHLKLLLEDGGRVLPAIAFGMADRPVEVGESLDVLYTPMKGLWNGSETLELRLKDFRRAGGVP